MTKYLKLPYFIAFIFIFSAVFLFFHNLFFGEIIATNDISTNDLLYLYLPVKKLYSEALIQGELLQWTPYIYGGFPVFAEGQGGFLYPLNLLLFYLLQPVAAMNSYIIIHALLMGAGMYKLASRVTRSNLASIPAAAAAAVCGSIIAGHTRHPHAVTAIVCLPWLIYSVELFIKSASLKRAVFTGLLLGIMFLCGHPQYIFISSFYTILYVFLRIFYIEEKGVSYVSKLIKYRVFSFLIVSLVIAAVIGSPQLLSTYELALYTQRAQNLDAGFTGNGSMPFYGFLTFIYPYYLGDAGNGSFKADNLYLFWEFFYYSGALIFLLAVYGTIKMMKRRDYKPVIMPLLIMFVLSYLLSLGDNLPLYKIFSMFPLIKSFRFPVRWFVGSEICLLVLSGFGVLALAEKFYPKHKTEGTAKKPKNKYSSQTIQLPILFKTTIILSFAVIFEIYIFAGKQVVTADSSIYLGQPTYVEKIKSSNKYSPDFRLLSLGWNELHTNIFRKNNGWSKNQEVYGTAAKILPPNLGSYYNIPIIDGYLTLVPQYIYEVWGDANNQGIVTKTASAEKNIFLPTDKFIKLSRLFGVKYLTSIWNINPPYEKMWDSSGVKAYELNSEMPKTWVVSKVQLLLSMNEKNNALNLLDTNFNPWRSAFVEDKVPELPSDSKNGSAEIINYSNHVVKIKANEPGFVVLNDTWYPRWKAYIDDKEVPVYKTDIMLRGVVAPKAGTIIEMRFDYTDIFILFIVSYSAIFFSIGYLFYCRRNLKSENNLSSM